MEKESKSFLARHEFLVRRLHSLSGLVPVGAYMVVHLLTNASVLDSDRAFQLNVNRIHSLGGALWVVEWTFIFIPILFHAILGIAIIREGLPNTSNYPYPKNIRYTLQRASGIIAFLFIMWHVFHTHGWFHSEWWLANIAKPFGGANFAPYAATSTMAEAMQASIWVIGFYFVGVTASVFHLANGIWTMGITWGVWTTPEAQRRANIACTIFGVLLLSVGLGAWSGFAFLVDPDKARQTEDEVYESQVEAGVIDPERGAEKRPGGH